MGTIGSAVETALGQPPTRTEIVLGILLFPAIPARILSLDPRRPAVIALGTVPVWIVAAIAIKFPTMPLDNSRIGGGTLRLLVVAFAVVSGWIAYYRVSPTLTLNFLAGGLLGAAVGVWLHLLVAGLRSTRTGGFP